MAVVTRYFSPTAAGAADGTTWADRAELDPSGAWSTVITGFDFSGSDTLRCLVGPGTSTVTAALASGSFANPPSVANLLQFHACDSNGALLAVPDPDWVSPMPAFDDSNLPVIATTTNIITTSLANCSWNLIKFTASGRNGAMLTGGFNFNWCVGINSTANTAAQVTSSARASNCVFKCTGSSYSAVSLNLTTGFNCRIEGVTGSSGNRQGINSGSTARFVGCTVVNCGGSGIINSGGTAGLVHHLHRCTIANNGAVGFLGNATASQTDTHEVIRCMITGNATYGIDANTNSKIIVADSRLRDNTTANFNSLGNYADDHNNYTTDSDDSTEYVSTGANGDFRIKNTASIWGGGYGAGDQPAGGGLLRPVGVGGGLV